MGVTGKTRVASLATSGVVSKQLPQRERGGLGLANPWRSGTGPASLLAHAAATLPMLTTLPVRSSTGSALVANAAIVANATINLRPVSAGPDPSFSSSSGGAGGHRIPGCKLVPPLIELHHRVAGASPALAAPATANANRAASATLAAVSSPAAPAAATGATATATARGASDAPSRGRAALVRAFAYPAFQKHAAAAPLLLAVRISTMAPAIPVALSIPVKRKKNKKTSRKQQVSVKQRGGGMSNKTKTTAPQR